jgi:hypothetical protein
VCDQARRLRTAVRGLLALGLALGAELLDGPADNAARRLARVGFLLGRLEGLGELRRACAPVRTFESRVSRSNSSFVWIFDRESVDGIQSLDKEPGGVPSGASGQLAVPATLHV